MSVIKSNYNRCTDCKGMGFIITPTFKLVASCIICNGSGTTSHGPKSEQEQVMLFKIAWDYINGKKKWYH